MAIEFRCGECGRLLRVDDDSAGRMARCPECGSQTPVPFPEQDEPTAADPDETLPYGVPGDLPRQAAIAEPSSVNPYQSPVEPSPPPAMPPSPRPASDNSVTASLTLGITGLILGCCCPLLGFPFSAGGLYMGIKAINSPQSSNRGGAIVGIVLSALGILLTIASIIGRMSIPLRHFGPFR